MSREGLSPRPGSSVTDRRARGQDPGRGRGPYHKRRYTERDLRSLDAQIRAIVQRYRKLPPPQRLLVESPNWGTRVLTIENLPDWIAVVPAHVTVPEQLRNPDPAIAALKEADHLATSGQPRSRALRLLQALATAATGRGYTVTAAAAAKDQYGRPVRDPVHLRFRCGATT